METPIVEVIDLRKSYGNLEVLHGVSLNCSKGDVVAVLGPSGSGKSTMLRCINHLERPNSGIIRVDGEQIGYERRGKRLIERSDAAIARQRQQIGMVFQRFNLYGHMTAAENVAFALMKLKRLPRANAMEIAGGHLNNVGLHHKRASYPSELSGGQQQRVAIARALAMSPKVMLFDEPTSALDPELVGEVLGTIERLAADGTTMIVVTHELHFARQAASRVVFMADGLVVEHGPPALILESPKTERLATFVSRVFRRA